MKIHIDSNVGIEDVKKLFNDVYPFLKLEFFKFSHDEGEASRKLDLIKDDVSLDDIRTKYNENGLDISPENSVNDVEQGFEELFGIHAQVFRKSKNLWLETTVTDNWTLREQNQTGKDMES